MNRSSKSFWKNPEGVTGGIVLAGLLVGGGMLLYNLLPTLIVLAQNTLYLGGMLIALGAVIYILLDPQARNLIWYNYKAVMRWITGLFVKIDPISILKSYLSDIEKSLMKLSKQIGALRGQMRLLKGTMDGNAVEIENNMQLADKARKQGDDKNLTLAARKAARLQEANAKYENLYGKMDVLYRILTRMYENAEIVLEDTRDQIYIKEQEYLAIKAGHGAIQSAQSVLKGDSDQRALFDRALEQMADEMGAKVGEMERFMDTSRRLMDSIDLQKGEFEEEGLRMLEQWGQSSLLLSGKTDGQQAQATPGLDLTQKPKEILRSDNDYGKFFE
ncbi:MAG: hypothetical protein ACK4NS_04720 [Saprospiraceae bacterium]